ncbi:MAG: prolyl oligopeptidase family serine peptidase [bacterium]|nr:prolyl oligopeptidase family serine peptidase [bacterium]
MTMPLKTRLGPSQCDCEVDAMYAGTPPPTARHPVIDTLHGEAIADPYRWLEEEDQAVATWTEAQNRYAEAVLDSLPERAAFARELDDLLQQDAVGDAALRGRRVFYTLRRAGEAQFALWVQDLDGRSPPRALVDPNRESREGTLALDWWHASPSGDLVAYGLLWDGDEWSTLHVLRTDTGEVLADRIPRARYASVAWDADEQGLLYTRYPRAGDVPPGEENYHRHVFHHRLGDDPAVDPLVYGRDRPKEEMYGVERSGCGRHLLLTISHGWTRTDVYVRREGDGGFQAVAVGKDALFTGQIEGDTLYLLTNYRAPRYRVLAIDLSDLREEAWRELVPEQEDVILQEFRLAGGKLLISGLKDAASRLYLYEPAAGCCDEVDLGIKGTVSGMAAEAANAVALIRFESFTMPPVLYRLDVTGGAAEIWLGGRPPADAGEVDVSQVFYRSADGTRVPMFLVRRRGITGPVPALLTGYGGFNLSRTPVYSPECLSWIRRGGLYAVANLRGGSEYGEDWHRAGMLEKKQNVFDDFIAAAEHLIEAGWTDPGRLGISGRSNGGLLVGAALTQRPELFRAVVCGVPLLDMLRYHHFLIARLWVTEYGSADDPEAFRWLRAYSPYHRVEKGTEYPAVFLFTAVSDTRVHPLHARKMAAMLQYATRSDPVSRPVILTVETEAGHGVGKPVGKIVRQQAAVLAFLGWQTGLTV